jgi:hypothetical protein
MYWEAVIRVTYKNEIYTHLLEPLRFQTWLCLTYVQSAGKEPQCSKKANDFARKKRKQKRVEASTPRLLHGSLDKWLHIRWGMWCYSCPKTKTITLDWVKSWRDVWMLIFACIIFANAGQEAACWTTQNGKINDIMGVSELLDCTGDSASAASLLIN